MEVEFLILSRYAEADPQNNTLNILGAGLTGIQATEFPMVPSTVFAAMRLRFAASEYGRSLRMQVVMVNGRGETIHEAMDGKVEIGTPPPPRLYVVMNATFTLANVIYPEPGYYRLVLRIDGQPVKETIFKVEQIERPQGQEERHENLEAAAT